MFHFALFPQSMGQPGGRFQIRKEYTTVGNHSFTKQIFKYPLGIIVVVIKPFDLTAFLHFQNY